MRSGYTAATPERTVPGAHGEPTPCPICDTTMAPSFEDQEAVYKLCPRCAYLKPCLIDLDAFAVNVKIYGKRYDEQLQTTAVVTDKARRKFTRFLDRIDEYRQLGRMLDIGCGGEDCWRPCPSLPPLSPPFKHSRNVETVFASSY